MEEYGVSPDELVAKAFRVIQSSRRGYKPYGKREWIAAVKKLHNQGGSLFAGDLQDREPYLYNQGVWFFGDWNKELAAAGFDPERTRLRSSGDSERIIKGIHGLQKQNLPLSPKYVMKTIPSYSPERGGIRNVEQGAAG
jgi:hypothetical protein